MFFNKPNKIRLRRSLDPFDIIISDLQKYLTEEEHIISKETLQSMVTHYQDKMIHTTTPFNCVIVDLEKIDEFIWIEIDNARTNKMSFRKQCIVRIFTEIEGGEDFVHYSAADFQFNPDNKYNCFLADAFFSSNMTECKEVLEKLTNNIFSENVYFVSDYAIQNDWYSCPFFSLSHAIAMSEAQNLYQKLKSIADHTGCVTWNKLPAKFSWNAQSWKYITNFVDDNYSDHMQDDEPEKGDFGNHIANSIKVNQDCKVQNHGITKFGRELAEELIHSLRSARRQCMGLRNNIYPR